MSEITGNEKKMSARESRERVGERRERPFGIKFGSSSKFLSVLTHARPSCETVDFSKF